MLSLEVIWIEATLNGISRLYLYMVACVCAFVCLSGCETIQQVKRNHELMEGIRRGQRSFKDWTWGLERWLSR